MPGFKSKDHLLSIYTQRLSKLHGHPGEMEKNQALTIYGGRKESGRGMPGLDTQPLLQLLSTTKAEKQISSAIFPAPYQASSSAPSPHLPPTHPSRECLTQTGRTDSRLLRAN